MNSKSTYINESLTAHNGAVLKKARKDLQAEGFKHVWTKNGKTFARKDDNSRKYVIHTLEDITKVLCDE